MRIFKQLDLRLRELDMNQSEIAQILGMTQPAFSARMTGRTPFTEPEMQRLLSEIGQPEETLADLFPRRDIGRKR